MRKLSTILFTILFLGISFSYSFASCDNFGSGSVTRSNSAATYIKNDGTSNTPVVAHGTPLVMTDVKQINRFEQYINFRAQGNFVYFTFDISLESPHFRMIKNLPAPRLFPVSSSTDSLYCSYVYYSSNDNTTSTIDNISQSPAPSTYFQTYNFVLECPVHQNWDTSNVSNYRLIWEIYYGLNYPNSDYSLNADYQLVINVAQSFGYSYDSCTNEDIIGSLDSINDSVVDVGDKLDSIGDFIADDSVSTSVLGATSFFNQQDGSYYGLADFVTAVINFMKAIYNDYSCTPLELPAILGTTITLPCFSEWLHDFNETIYNLWKMVLYFYVGFVICSDLIKFIHDLRDPQNDNLTVMDI